jgi:hypothetical protein
LAVLSFQAPSGAHPGTRARTAPRAGAAIHINWIFSSSRLLLIPFSIGNSAGFFSFASGCRFAMRSIQSSSWTWIQCLCNISTLL